MENKVCCCFGHREIYLDFSRCLEDVIEELIVENGVNTFMTGGMGQFDGKFAAAVRSKKNKYPEIKLILVYPYFTQELNRNKEWYEHNFDSIIIPSELSGIHYKSAIKARNRWIVDNSDYIVAMFTVLLVGHTTLFDMLKNKRKRYIISATKIPLVELRGLIVIY